MTVTSAGPGASRPGGQGLGDAVSANWRETAILLLGLITVGFHVHVVFSGLIPNLITRPGHLAVALPWIFVVGVAGSLGYRLVSYLLCAIGLAGCGYIMLNRPMLVDQYGALDGWFQYVVAIALILVVLEMARRAIQPVLPAVALLVLMYGIFGQHLPASIGHAGIPMDYFLGTLVIAEGGLWGSLTGISIDLIVPFLILGAIVSAGEAGKGFMSLATQLAGRFRAGSAKVSVLASAMYGTISGSASANVASTGAITIPAMIRLKYPAPFAASVEAVASTGGQIMPPVMGAGVFIMAELLRVPYTELMVASILPGVLFFLAAWAGVHFFALRYGLGALDPRDLPGWALVGRTTPFFLLPFVILIWMLFGSDYSPGYIALIAAGVSLVLLAADDRLRISLGLFWQRARVALIDASRQIAMIAAIIICAGIITGVFHATGLGVKITSLIIGISGGQLWLALLLTAAACIILGMELPTTAAYLICISVAGPALIQMGLPELHAHLFVFWYALLCTITPPVCGNVFIAASIARTPWMPVSLSAMRIGLGLFIIPVGFVANPALLTLATDPAMALLAAAKLGLGLILLSYATICGAVNPVRAFLLGVVGVAVIFLFGVGA
ncbi:TRAP transporter fused permease subunit [Telmatospirillum sp. J64-1]|uniref:TRAP transporter permease n=1 Tax=Telmatospirillum sp. J64-1 TaxID=2502183 RepID=UPI00115C6EDD|nr:TRAP transporter fused permease subunit [Telmatospirillum sp. J64-1]